MFLTYKMDDTAKKIEKIRSIIRKKYEELNDSSEQASRLFTKTYEPLISPLRKIADEKNDISETNKNVEVKKTLDDSISTNSDEYLIPNTSGIIESEEISQKYQVNEFGVLAKSYITNFVSGKKEDFDFVYGPHYNLTDGILYMGKFPLHFDNFDNIKIGKRTYNGSKGLFELIFKNQPDEGYTDDDMNNYADILSFTKTYLQDTRDRVKSNAGYKYKNIIKKALAIIKRKKLD